MYKTFMTYLHVKVQSGYAFFFFHAESFISLFMISQLGGFSKQNQLNLFGNFSV